MNLRYTPIAWSAIQDPAIQGALKQTDDNLRAAFDALTSTHSVDARRGSEVSLQAPITPRVLLADPTLTEAFGRVNEVAVLPETAQLFVKQGRTGMDTAWLAVGGAASIIRTIQATPALFDIPNSVDLEPISAGSQPTFARSDHHHDLDQDIAPEMTNAWNWAPDKDVVPITLTGRVGQTVNYRESYDNSGMLREVLTPNFLEGWDDSTPAARRSIQALGGSTEADVLALGPILWLSASDVDLADNAGLVDGSHVDTWHDKSAIDNFVPKAGSSVSPLLCTVAGTAHHPATLPNLRPCVTPDNPSAFATWGLIDPYVGVPDETTFTLTDYTVVAVVQTNDAFGGLLAGIPHLEASGADGSFVGMKFDAGSYYLDARYRLGGQYEAGPVVFPAGSWMRVTLVRSGATHTFYVDDVQVPANPSQTSGPISGTQYFSNICGSWESLGGGNGTFTSERSPICELMLFDSALSADDLAVVWGYLDAFYFDGSNYLAHTAGGTSVALDEWKSAGGTVLSQVSSSVKWALGWAGPAVKRLDVRDSGGIRLGSNATPTGYIDVIAADSGLITYDAVGSGTPEHRFADLVNVRAAFHVGSADQFQVDLSGDIIKLKNLTYSWPTSHVASGKLRNDGSGTLTWVADDTDLTAISALTGTGILVRTGTDTWALRTLQAPATGFTITNPAGVAGDPTFVLANDLAALEGLSSTGIAVRTMTDTWVQRTITASDSRITVTNPGGIAGNIDLTILGEALTTSTTSNVTLSALGSPTNSLLAGVELAVAWSGQLSVTRGGTGDATLTANNLLVGAGTSAVTFIAPGTSGNVLQSNGTVFQSVSLSTAGVQPLDADLTEIAAVANVRGDLLLTDSGPTWVRLPIGTSGTILRSDGTDAAWATLATAGIQPLDADLTEIAAVANVRGDLLVTNSGPTWIRLAVGSASTLLKSDGTDPSWGTVNLLSAFHGDTTAGTVARGDIITGQAASPTWKRLALGASATILRSDGTDVAWASLATAGIASGTGTTGTLTKWTNTNGVLGDSLISESGSTLTVNGTIIPNAAGTREIGSSAKPWLRGFVGDFYSPTTGFGMQFYTSDDAGGNLSRFGFSTGDASTAVASFANLLAIHCGGATITDVGGAITPNVTDTVSLGSVGLRWGQVYAVEIRVPESGGTNYSGFTSPAMSADINYVLPATVAASNGSLLASTTAGVLSWASLASLGANPSASVGLAAVNGSATTYMRSDGAPALSQSIAPTWSAVHTFSLQDVHTLGIDLSTSGRLNSQIADGATAVAFLVKPTNALPTAGAQVFQLQDSAGGILLAATESATVGGAVAINQAASAATNSTILQVANRTTNTQCAALSFVASAQWGGSGSTFAGITNTVAGININTQSSSSASNTGGCLGAGITMATTPVNRGLSDYWGVAMQVGWSTGGTIGGTVTDGGGIKITGSNTGGNSPTATNWYGILVKGDNTRPTTITNQYGLYIDERTKGGTIKDGIFLACATTSYRAIAIRDQNAWIGSDAAGELTIGGTTCNIKSTNIGFHGTAGTAQDTGWGSITNVTTDRAYDANATSLDEIADVLGTLIAKLVAKGIIGA